MPHTFMQAAGATSGITEWAGSKENTLSGDFIKEVVVQKAIPVTEYPTMQSEEQTK